MTDLISDWLKEKSVGLCFKDSKKQVLVQNARCIEICGDQKARVCEEGCMENYVASTRYSNFAEGATLRSGISRDGKNFDAVIFNDSNRILTMLYPLEKKNKKGLSLLAKYHLSKRETEIAGLVLSGETRATICAKLHVSRATLKTHLNNIYKKIPEELANVLKARR